MSIIELKLGIVERCEIFSCETGVLRSAALAVDGGCIAVRRPINLHRSAASGRAALDMLCFLQVARNGARRRASDRRAPSFISLHDTTASPAHDIFRAESHDAPLKKKTPAAVGRSRRGAQRRVLRVAQRHAASVCVMRRRGSAQLLRGALPRQRRALHLAVPEWCARCAGSAAALCRTHLSRRRLTRRATTTKLEN